MMLKKSDFTKQVYKTGEVAKILGVTNQTIQNYDRDGRLKVGRSGGGHRAIARKTFFIFWKRRACCMMIHKKKSQMLSMQGSPVMTGKVMGIWTGRHYSS